MRVRCDLGDHWIVCASHLQRPFWYFEHMAHYYILNPLNDPTLTTIKGVAKRAIVGVLSMGGLVATLPLVLLACCVKKVGNRLRRKEFTYWKGNRREKLSLVNHKVTHLNTCMLPGGLPYLFGGMRTARERLEQLERFIHAIDPDLVFLCEVSSTLSSRLYHLFAGSYTHFFLNIGSATWGMEAGMAIMSRMPILDAYFFPSHVVAEGVQKLLARGYFFIETEAINYLYVHLHPKETKRAKEVRREQLEEVSTIIRAYPQDKPCVILGDFNVDRKKTQHNKTMNARGFSDLFYGHYGPTATTMSGRSVDGILTLKEEKLRMEITINETSGGRVLPLSDHKGITATIALP